MQACGGIGFRAAGAPCGGHTRCGGGARRRSLRRDLAVGIGLLLALAAVRPVHAAKLSDAPFEITADSIEMDEKAKLYVAEGHVRIVQEKTGRSLEADWVVFSNETRRGAASGNVVMADEDERLVADFALFDVDTLQGLVRDGYYRKVEGDGTNLRLRAIEMVKSGEDSYEFWKGVFTTCNCPDPESRDPWTLHSSSGDIEVGGYGRTWNNTFEILGVPAIWLPWVMFPVKTERESGILFPSFGISNRRGYEVDLPIFFAIGDPVNLTLTPSWLSKRGFKQNAQLEFVVGERSWGEAHGSYIHDRQTIQDQDEVDRTNEQLLAQDQVPYVDDVPYNQNRWGFKFEGEAFGPDTVRAFANVVFLSDNEYPSDYQDFAAYNKDRFLESLGFVDAHTDGAHPVGGWLGARWANDLQSPDDEDRDEFLLQRYTEFSTRWLPEVVSRPLGLVAAFDTDYINFRARDNPQDQVGSTSVLVNDEFFDTGIEALPDARETPNRKILKVAANPPPELAGQTITPIYDPNNDNDKPVDRQYNQDLVTSLGGPTTGAGSETHCRAAVANLGGNPDTCVPVTAGPQQDGIFQEGEPLADEGQRLSLYPTLSRPIPMGHFTLTPELGYRENLYWSDRQNFEENGVTTARTTLATRLVRRFQGDENVQYSHLMTPGLSWVYANPRGQQGDPVFVPQTRLPQTRLRQLDTDNVFRDPTDRMVDTNEMILSLENRFFQSTELRRIWLADLTLSAAWDFQADSMGELIADGRTARWYGVGSEFHISVNPDHAEIDEGLIDLNWNAPFDANFGVRYRYLRDIPLFFENYRGINKQRFDEYRSGFTHVSQIDLRGNIPFFDALVLGGQFTYSFEDKISLHSEGSLDYVSRCKCWAAGVQVIDSRNNGLQTLFRVTLLGPGSNLHNPFQGGGPINLKPLGF